MRFPAILVSAAVAAVLSIGDPLMASAKAAWPERPVRIVTSLPVGTAGDISARLYAERLSARWGKPVIVENKPGADGILAVMAVLGARDQHTLLYINGGPVTTNASNHPKLAYDPRRDLLPVSSGADVTIVISAPTSLKVGSIGDFVNLARSKPNTLNWGATPGALDYVVPAFFKSEALGVERVAYKDIAPAMQDLAESRIHLYISGLAAQLGLVKSGKIKILAITNRQRSPLLPDVPTVSESGYSGLELDGLLGFFVPAGTPQDVVDQIGDGVRWAGSDPAIRERLSAAGLVVRTTTAAEFASSLDQERQKVEAFAGK